MQDREFEECMDEVAAINSEMRHLTLELMKIAARRNLTFEQVSKEFVLNTSKLRLALANAENEKKL